MPMLHRNPKSSTMHRPEHMARISRRIKPSTRPYVPSFIHHIHFSIALKHFLPQPSTNSPQTKDRIMRAEAAQTNGFENLAFFASAVVAGNLAGLPAQTLNTLSGGYLISRVLYNLIYINNTSKAIANTRSVVFVSGVGMIFTLFIKSGNILRERAANLL